MGFLKQVVFAVFSVVLIALGSASPTVQPLQDGYVETGQCEDNNVCLYTYNVSQQFFQGDALQNYTLSAVVRVDCYSVGTFNELQATEYCLNVKDMSLPDIPFSEDNREQQQAMNKLLAGQFCFVQVENGHVVEVFYEEDSNPEGVNLKKSIAAAFQANFQNQEEEEEEDPQSVHMAHYSYEATGNENQIKMHRSVSNGDIRKYSTGARVKDVQLEKEEDIEYRSRHLYHSSGLTTVKMAKSRQRVEGRRVTLPDGPLNDDLFSANGSYTLDLLRCYTVSQSVTRGRRSAKRPMTSGSLEAVVDKSSLAKSEMEDLRKAMPPIQQVLRRLYSNPENTKLSNQLERLLILESEFGTLPGYKPALDAVIAFMMTIEDAIQPADIAMRYVLYSMLSAEGSYKSQETLIRALQYASTESEQTSIVSFIAFIHQADPALLTVLEQKLVSANNYLDPLLLAYGALASETTTASEQRIVTFLLSRLKQAPNNDTILIHFIHALGNTGSLTALDTIVSFLNHSALEVQLVSISAMRKLIDSPLVEEALYSMLQITPASYEHVVAIAETLSAGYKYLSERDTDYTPPLDLQLALVSSAVQLGDLELAELVLSYVENFESLESEGMIEALEDVIATVKEEQVPSRERRGTDWDESNSNYDVVASQRSRAADVRNYANHRAYIWGKTIGISKANIKIGAGLFIGRHPTCPNFKIFGKAVAKATILRWSWNILHAEALVEKTDSHVRIKLYFKLRSNVLVDYSSTATNCATHRRTHSSPRYSLGRYSYGVFIYVGTLTLYIQPRIQAHIDSRVELCTNSRTLRAFAGIGPRLTFTVEGGVVANIASLVRGGVSVDVIFNYRLEGSGEGRLCSNCAAGLSTIAYAQTCIGLHGGWPNNRVELYAWYQRRRVRMCRRRIWGKTFRYPCGIEWGSRHRWNRFSWSWNLPSRQLTPLYNTCGRMRNPTCPLPNTPPPPPYTIGAPTLLPFSTPPNDGGGGSGQSSIVV